MSIRIATPDGFSRRAVTGARFEVANQPELTADDAAPTLFFIAFPYLRELVSSLTARSPVSEAHDVRP